MARTFSPIVCTVRITGSFGLTKTSNNPSLLAKQARPNMVRNIDQTFTLILKESISDGISESLGPQTLRILLERGFLDNPTNTAQLHAQLAALFGNGAVVLERIMVKELYRKLSIPFDLHEPFDYGNALARATQTYSWKSQFQ